MVLKTFAFKIEYRSTAKTILIKAKDEDTAFYKAQKRKDTISCYRIIPLGERNDY